MSDSPEIILPKKPRSARHTVHRRTDCVRNFPGTEVRSEIGGCGDPEESRFPFAPVENAMGLFSKLAIKYPKNHILLTNLAKCEIKCNKKQEAKEHLRQALMIFDDFEDALNLLEELNNDQ